MTREGKHNNEKTFRNIIVGALAGILVLTTCAPAFAADGPLTADDVVAAIHEFNLWEDRVLREELSFSNADQRMPAVDASALPAKLDLRDFNGKNYVSPVKNQSPWGTCWSFGGIAAAETSIAYDNGHDYNNETDEIEAKLFVDPLTGLQSRNAYSKMLKELDQTGMPFDFVVIMIDVNGLKQVNDTMGHEAGDELICGAADCIRRVLGNAYRIGGDEFVYMGTMSRTQANEAMARLHLVTSTWRGERVSKLSFSAGCAIAADHPSLGAGALAREADKEMYAAKARYYRESGVDRRRR